MQLNDLGRAPGARQAPKRVGRGIGSGLGKTSGRGHKGQKARSGGSIRPGFEGGQMPMQRRLPKRGFTNIFAKELVIVNLRDLSDIPAGTEVTPEYLLASGLIRKVADGLKILADGELTVGLNVRAHAFSERAREKILAAGGTAEVI